jgi:hypothetical protein
MRKQFSELKIGAHFRVSGYDDLFLKVNHSQAKSLGCGWLKRTIRLARKGELVNFATHNELVTLA